MPKTLKGKKKNAGLDDELTDLENELNMTDEDLSEDKPKKKSTKKVVTDDEDELDLESELEDAGEEETEESEEEEETDELEDDPKPKKLTKKDESEETEEADWETIKIGDVVIPKNKVRDLDQQKVKEKAISIKQNGMLYPILINEDGVLLDGMTRLEAHKLLKLKEIRCITLKVKKDENFLIGSIGNIGRDNMSDEEEGRVFRILLMDEEKFPTQKDLAKTLGISESRISRGLTAIGESKKYAEPKAKKASKAVKKEKAVALNKEGLPDAMSVKISKSRIVITLDFPFRDVNHAKKFNVVKEFNSVIKKIEPRDFNKEMQIIRKEL